MVFAFKITALSYRKIPGNFPSALTERNMTLPRSIILGVDFSGAALAGEKIWVARGRFNGTRLEFDFLERASNLPDGAPERETALKALCAWIGANPDAACGLDFPFSLVREAIDTPTWRDWLQASTNYDNAIQFKEAFEDGRRRTDKNAKTPFSPLNHRLFRQTFHGIRDVLAPLAATSDILPFDAPGEKLLWLLEICPASWLKKENLYLSYKGKSETQRTETQKRVPCSASAEIEAKALEDTEGDALDALLSAVCTLEALRHPDDLPARDEIDRFEGRVYF
jgi:hypothetical protein